MHVYDGSSHVGSGSNIISASALRTREQTDFIQIPQRVDSVKKNSSDWLVHSNTDQIVPLLDHTTISKCCVNLSLVCMIRLTLCQQDHPHITS